LGTAAEDVSFSDTPLRHAVGHPNDKCTSLPCLPKPNGAAQGKVWRESGQCILGLRPLSCLQRNKINLA
jgi:hypothetical protein